MTVYGITTCGSVKKALKFFKDNGIDYTFVDFKKTPPTKAQIDNWTDKGGLDRLLNTKGTKYKTLKLKDLNLDENGIKEWMEKEPLIIKRPVIEDSKGVQIGFEEALYRSCYL